VRRGSLLLLLLILIGAYLATGLYVVRGNEKVAVRRFGRAIRGSEGRVQLQPSGLHYELPWPFSRIDRVNVHEVRTMTIGVGDSDEIPEGGFLRSLETANRSQFLTGDKNILHMQVTAQYHVSESAADDYLFRTESSQEQLQQIVEAVVTDLVSRSGVDFVHPLGQVELNAMLTADVRRLAATERLGIEVDDVTINAVYPPVLVKAYFLDVTSARADKINSVNEANAYAEQRRAAATAEVRRTRDEAASYRQQTVESARARAESFTRMVGQFRDEERSGIHSYAQSRKIALDRYYVDTMRDVLKSVSAKVLLDSSEPADLTIFGRPETRKPAEAK
jgi:membrane protease subunit HflK